MKRTFSPHEVPEEYKRKAERNMAACKAEASTNVKSEEKQETKKISSKGQGLLSGKVKVDESLKHDLKLKAEVKVTVRKGSSAEDLQHSLSCTKAEESKKVLAKLKEERVKEKKRHLDRIMQKLLNSVPGKQKVDLTYLLDDGKRVRKKLVK